MLVRVEHPLIDDFVTKLRDSSTPPQDFRLWARKVATLLAYDASRDLPTREIEVQTPLEKTTGKQLGAGIVLVPVLRAGIGMLESMLELFPDAVVGYVGLERDEMTAEARHYYRKLPDLVDRRVLLLDPMLATGGSALAAIEMLQEAGGTHIRLLSIVAAPEGVEFLEKNCPDVAVYVAAMDRELNERKFILPGLGDFGDRLYGT